MLKRAFFVAPFSHLLYRSRGGKYNGATQVRFHSHGLIMSARYPSPWIRHVLSAVIAFHFALLFLLLAGNVSSSPLQNALRYGFRGYVQLLNIDPDYTPLYLTQADQMDTGHLVEFTAESSGDDNWRTLRDTWTASESRQRALRLAQTLANRVESENETSAAELARSLAEYVYHQQGIRLHRIRVRRHLLQPSSELRFRGQTARSPADPSFYNVVYSANVLIDEQGRALVNKIDREQVTAAPNPETEASP